MTGEYVCLTYNRSETYTVYHSKLACTCPPVSMMLFVCPDLLPSCLFHCHHRGVDKFVRLWGWDVEYCCTLYIMEFNLLSRPLADLFSTIPKQTWMVFVLTFCTPTLTSAFNPMMLNLFGTSCSWLFMMQCICSFQRSKLILQEILNGLLLLLDIVWIVFAHYDENSSSIQLNKLHWRSAHQKMIWIFKWHVPSPIMKLTWSIHMLLKMLQKYINIYINSITG